MKSRMLIITAVFALAALANLSLAASAQTTVTAPASASDSDSASASQSSQNETGLTSVEGIDIIEELALEDWQEAMDVYSSFTKRMIRDEAKNPQDLQRLLKATQILTEFDGANEHYFLLVDLWKAFPSELEAAIKAMPVETDSQDEILFTIQSFADVIENGNG